MKDRLRIAPFPGMRYNPEKVPELSKVIAPPYDMISPEEQRLLYERHPWNIVRLILTRDDEEDSFADRYERAAAHYRRWQQERVLLRDPNPAIYAYRQDYEWGGQKFERLGFISRVALTEFGEGAFPHESTLSGPKADRLRLLTACRANFSSIFALFSDEGGRVQDRLGAETASAPLVRVEDDKGVVHSLWQLARPEFHSWLNEQMRDRKFIIADGHHRYETALEYRRLMQRDPAAPKVDWDYVMMFLAPIESPGLTILPFHRVVPLPNAREAHERLSQAFELTELPAAGTEREAADAIQRFLDGSPEERSCLGFYGGGPRAFGLTMKKGFDKTGLLRPGTSSQVGDLDVTILHQAVLGGLLGLDEQGAVQEGKISFFTRPEDAVARVRESGEKAAFFLRPTRIGQVWEIALSGQKMPQKSTNFYPKLTTGLVVNQL